MTRIPVDRAEAIRWGKVACKLGSDEDCKSLQQLCEIGIAEACVR